MGEQVDYLLDDLGYSNADGPPEPEDYLGMSDDELRKATALCRTKKLKSIRSWPHALSPKQRYCLAAWLAERDSRIETAAQSRPSLH